MTDFAFLKNESGRHIFFNHSTSKSLKVIEYFTKTIQVDAINILADILTSYSLVVLVCDLSMFVQRIYQLHMSGDGFIT